jgi:hypothetical protein
VFAVDAALQHTCAELREQATRGQITSSERDLLIDGAILLALHLEELIQDARAGTHPLWPEAAADLGRGSFRVAS